MSAPNPAEVQHWWCGGSQSVTFMDFLTADELAAMNAAADAMTMAPGLVMPHPERLEVGERGADAISKAHRDCDFCYFTEAAGPVSVPLFERLERYVAFVNERYFGFELGDGKSREWMVSEYGIGGHFDFHIDWGRADTIRSRKLTTVMQMTPAHEYEGGDLEIFAGWGVQTANRAPGMMIVFPSFMYHRVTPVKRGRRRSCITWFRGSAPLQ